VDKLRAVVVAYSLGVAAYHSLKVEGTWDEHSLGEGSACVERMEFACNQQVGRRPEQGSSVAVVQDKGMDTRRPWGMVFQQLAQDPLHTVRRRPGVLEGLDQVDSVAGWGVVVAVGEAWIVVVEDTLP